MDGHMCSAARVYVRPNDQKYTLIKYITESTDILGIKSS